ncbi:hypothetical protein ACHAWT_003976 [Skeletonema menzelii]
MSITEKSPNSVEDVNDGEEEDFVNISFLEEEGKVDGGSIDVNLDERQRPAVVTFPSMRTQTSDRQDGGDDNNINNLSASDDTAEVVDDRKPAAVVAASPARSQSKDARFMCAICIDTVSDEPVVTRCGHIFCWPCLYQWLAPGMLVNEYYAAFGGGGGGMGMGRNNHGGSRGNLNNFISEMATHSSNSHANRPYDMARFNSARRVCPVCKAFCSVDSVIPVYIHVHANSGSQADRQGDGTMQEHSLNEQQQHDNNGGDDNIIHPDESPLSPDALDPTAANIGLRQRRPLTASTSNVSNNTAPESPESTQNMYENIPSNATITPVIRNGGGDNIAVPNRPFLSPIPSASTNNNSNVPSADSRHQSQYDNQTAAPILNTSTIASSSSFRLAYRPRHVDYSQSIRFQNRQMGGLMGIVSGLVHSIDNIGTANPQNSSQGTTRDHQPEVPQIHRSDNGLGGVGRASERNNERGGEQLDGRGAAGVMDGEDSSLAMAREFLSRLLFMLACFVILCLLLF